MVKKSPPNHLRIALSVVSVVLLTLVMFQNCADPLNLASEDSLSINESVPFAFDTKIDTVAYMSCSDVPVDYDRRAYFSFRAGAYNAGSGITMREAFRNETAAYSTGVRAHAIADSPANRGSILQLAIRPPRGYQSVLTSSGTALENTDYQNMLVPLDTESVATAIADLKEDERVNYFPGLPGLDNRRIEGSVTFNGDETTAQSVRANFQQGAMLAVTYAPSENDGYSARAPTAGSTSEVYGQGLQLAFKLPPNRATGALRVLDRASEFNLESGSSSGAGIKSWTCNANLAFKIVRPQDTASCAIVPDPVNPAPAVKERLAAIRSVLRVEDWWVDLTNSCVVPKNTGATCYGNQSGQTVIYATNTDCSATDKAKLCAHYVSICTRQP